MIDFGKTPCIYILAGTNGAGKSSIAGSTFGQWGFYNPDDIARNIRLSNPEINEEVASIMSWEGGKELLKRAIKNSSVFALETTLGGDTITTLLEDALDAGLEVRVWYAGLSSPELHIERVRSRVARGGHDVPEERIRARYDSSRQNLIRLLPRLTELRVYDNSEAADPSMGATPSPKLILHLRQGEIVDSCGPVLVPEWAKAIMAAAIKASRSG